MGAYENWNAIKGVIERRLESTGDDVGVRWAYENILNQMNALDDMEKGEMHDTIAVCCYELFDTKPTLELVEEISNKIPEDLKQHADQWGWDDTEVRDQVYDWIEKNATIAYWNLPTNKEEL